MKANVGRGDRALRIAAGVALCTASALGVIGWWGYVGVIPLVTGAVGMCPAYRLLGLSTCPREDIPE